MNIIIQNLQRKGVNVLVRAVDNIVSTMRDRFDELFFVGSYTSARGKKRRISWFVMNDVPLLI